ncbi:MAG: energy-coupling factor transporter ATPase [Clostridia bacterium]|nr:energy-coupling factor transporter ATPase [Clostridia bacterium]
MDKIYLDHVSYIYGEGTPFEQIALDDVTLGIRGGCITGIIGHTGSGKSTMMQLLNGLTKPTHGKVFLDGYDINAEPEDVLEEWKTLPEYAAMKPRAAKKAIFAEVKSRRAGLCFRVGLVMQYPEYQLFEETVAKDIAFGPRNMGLSEAEIRERVLEAAAFTDIPEELLEKSPFDLSGGQKRRVALAGVIAMRPEVLVLDEPAAGLDPIGRTHIFNGIREYQKKTGSTVLIVSHSMEDMARYSDDVIVMAGAKVIRHGSRREVFAHVEELARTGLDIPQITHLMGLLHSRGLQVPQDVYTVDEALDAVRRLFEEGGAQ